MKTNNLRIAVIRRAMWGREVREPICKSLEVTLEKSEIKLNEAAAICDYRVIQADTAVIPDEDEQYKMLILTRANGE